MNKKIAMFLILVLSIAVISGCVQQTGGIGDDGVPTTTIGSEDEVGDLTSDMAGNIGDLGDTLEDIDDSIA